MMNAVERKLTTERWRATKYFDAAEAAMVAARNAELATKLILMGLHKVDDIWQSTKRTGR